MPSFPIFVDLKEKKCLVFGGGKTAQRKVESLLPFGPEIWVISPVVTTALEKLALNRQIKVLPVCYNPTYLKGSYLVIAATDQSAVNRLIYEQAVAENILVNVVDCPAECTFFFPAIVKRNDLVLGISTSGAFPLLAKELKKRLEDYLPEYYSELVLLLKVVRKKVRVKIADPGRRKLLLQKVFPYLLNEVAQGKLDCRRESAEVLGEQIINKYLKRGGCF